MFVDYAKITVKAGKGGNGLVSFRHERFVEKGGPDGGDGGDGGSIVVRGAHNISSLQKFRVNKALRADNGQPGGPAKRHGRNGKDIVIDVPIGSVITNEGQLVTDITEIGQEMVIAKGGIGGFGNAHFTTSRRQAPKVAEKGLAGDSYDAVIELKMIADIGLVGLPNAGKSTFLSVVTNAKPQIADYPFTTLIPNIGVADVGKGSLLVADIPGLIEGAASGKGLGIDFLRHIERTAVLLHMIDVYSNDVVNDYQTIHNELAAYQVDLSKRPTIVAIAKTDGLDKDIVDDQVKSLKKILPKAKIMTFSSKDKTGLTEVLRALNTNVKDYRKNETIENEEDGMPNYTLDDTDTWTVEKTKRGWLISGKKIEQFAAKTDFENEWGVVRLRDIMGKIGLMHELKRKGANSGDLIEFANSKDTLSL